MKNTKFIIIATRRQNPPNITITVEMLKASKKWLDDRKANGTIECMYLAVPDMGFTISNYNSAEDVYKDISDYPMQTYFDFEVKALASLDKSFEIDIANLHNSN